MNNFLKAYRLALTPLSPIHIGCGEDFEPTNYVIDDGVLYGFDPSRAALNDLQRGKLMDVASRGSLLAVQRFFKDNARVFKAQADTLIPVSLGVAEVYERKVGRAVNVEATGNMVFNQLFVERTMHTGRSGNPFIPGSSFKGAIRTAMLDHLNQGQPVTRPDEMDRRGAAKSEVVERRLLKGDFETSPLRLLKVGDLMPPAHVALERRVMFAVNRKKKQVIKDGQEIQPKGIAARKECILHGQYRAFLADAVLPSLAPHLDSKTTPATELRLADLRQVARYSNAYNRGRFARELSVLDGRGLVNPEWKRSLEALLNGELSRKLDDGDAFLIRLGRYGGAESKTLSGDGVAQIKIMQGHGQPAVIQGSTKTVWLAAEHESDQKHLLPFGWALVEIDPQCDLPQLKAWCEAQAKGRPDMVKLHMQFEADKAAAQRLKAEMVEQAAAREAAKQANEIACEQRAQALSSMNEQGKQTETLRRNCEDWAKHLPPVGNYRKQPADVGKAGFFQEACKLVAVAMASSDWTAQDKNALADMLEEWLPRVVAPWEKDQRKRLGLSALRARV